MDDAETKQLRTLLKEEFKTYHDTTLMPAFGAYTEDVVLPAIAASENRLREEIKEVKSELTLHMGKLRSDLIDFVSKQIADAKAEILKAIREEKEKDRLFKITVIDILRRNRLATGDELNLLQELTAPGFQGQKEKYLA